MKTALIGDKPKKKTWEREIKLKYPVSTIHTRMFYSVSVALRRWERTWRRGCSLATCRERLDYDVIYKCIFHTFVFVQLPQLNVVLPKILFLITVYICNNNVAGCDGKAMPSFKLHSLGLLISNMEVTSNSWNDHLISIKRLILLKKLAQYL